ncbi:zinc finger (MYND type) family protein / programmed cell death 2 C-terminal domain-containing protein [Zea mays]|uniref:Zinc finger (MYND type) family protein / programmed cell death 2 C-terminal domain-containing protein n=1 Tax=Zea mays TaxID=4577 RepID=A0A1D6LGK4_MAIZE|nr:zinc finger (MYND type) family protein / programmed cell death 2 C-terminal domain-containing protein [Zea mays]
MELPSNAGDGELLPMEEHKERALRHLLRRSKRPLEEFVAAVADVAEQLDDFISDMILKNGKGCFSFVQHNLPNNFRTLNLVENSKNELKSCDRGLFSSVKIFRCQLPRNNAFYSAQPPKHDGSDKPLCPGAPVCHWCGTWKGDKICSSCKKARYCYEKHQFCQL